MKRKEIAELTRLSNLLSKFPCSIMLRNTALGDITHAHSIGLQRAILRDRQASEAATS